MTCAEKLRHDHPEMGDEEIRSIIEDDCPMTYCNIEQPRYPNGGTRCSDYPCDLCWNREVPGTEPNAPTIKDSGTRQQFPTGAVRDIQKGKGRCDLLPLDVVAEYFTLYGEANKIIMSIHTFTTTGDYEVLFRVLDRFNEQHWKNNKTMFLELSMHFEEGAEKYGENNWQKGLPVKCYINSAVRHYLKFLREDSDERHDRAFCWNILCAIWTCKHKPELNEYGKKICPVCGTVIPDGETECPHCRVFTGTPDFLCELEEEYA